MAWSEKLSYEVEDYGSDNGSGYVDNHKEKNYDEVDLSELPLNVSINEHRGGYTEFDSKNPYLHFFQMNFENRIDKTIPQRFGTDYIAISCPDIKTVDVIRTILYSMGYTENSDIKFFVHLSSEDSLHNHEFFTNILVAPDSGFKGYDYNQTLDNHQFMIENRNDRKFIERKVNEMISWCKVRISSLEA
jgi:hypothetical protein